MDIDFDGFDSVTSPNVLHKNKMREFLRKLDLFPVGITQADIESLSAALCANHGMPDQLFISEGIFNTLKSITFDARNLKP